MSTSPIPHPTDQVLSAFNSGKLPEREAAAVNKHLRDCPTCRRRLAKASNQQAVSDAPKPRPAAIDPARAGGLDALVAAVQADAKEEPPFLRRKSPRWQKLVWPAAALGALVAGLGIGWGAGMFNATSSATLAKVEGQPVPIPPVPLKLTQQLSMASPAIRPPASNCRRDTAVTANGSSTTREVGGSSSSPSPDAATNEHLKQEKPAEDAPQYVAAREQSEKTQPPADRSKATAQEFFNGKDLANWQNPADVWHVEKGALVGSLPAGRSETAFLGSQQKYKDFDLSFRASVADGIGDCGVQFRSAVADVEKYQVVGPQCAIYGKDAPKNHLTGSLVLEPQGKVEKSAPAAKAARFVKPTENHFRIRCEGKHILIEVNGVKMVNGDFPSAPDEGIIAWKLDGNRPPRQATFKIIKFTDLSGSSPSKGAEQPALQSADLLKAEFKFGELINRADENLLKHFDAEIGKLQKSSHGADKELLLVVEGERAAFKNKGLIPWSRPMRNWLKVYGKELTAAREAVGKAFDKAIDRAEKAHNDKLKAALVEQAGQTLAPREVATWEIKNPRGEAYHRVFYSDGTYTEGNDQDGTGTRFWAPPNEDVVILEYPDKGDSTATYQQAFFLTTPDGKTLTTTAKNGQERVWRHVDD